MKSRELHRRFISAGWRYDHAKGSHYYYIKDGVISEPIPYHGSQEIPTGLAYKILKKYGI